MSEEVLLPQKYALALLRRLSDDDGFRARYAHNSMQALSEIGVPNEVLGRVCAQGSAPMQLADKSVFREALSMLVDDMVGVSLCQIRPQIHVFSPIKGKGVKSRIPFETPEHSSRPEAEIGTFGLQTEVA